MNDFKPGQLQIVAVPPRQFVAIDGEGAPHAFLDMAQALRAVLAQLGQTPGPLEALWWAADGGDMAGEAMDQWRWSVMLALPEPISARQLGRAVGSLRSESDDIWLEPIRLETYSEGPTVQLSYTGSLQNKAPELQQMLQHAADQGYEPHGKYHEIYLDDPGPNTPADARSILRQPVRL